MTKLPVGIIAAVALCLNTDEASPQSALALKNLTVGGPKASEAEPKSGEIRTLSNKKVENGVPQYEAATVLDAGNATSTCIQRVGCSSWKKGGHRFDAPACFKTISTANLSRWNGSSLPSTLFTKPAPRSMGSSARFSLIPEDGIEEVTHVRLFFSTDARGIRWSTRE